MRHLISEKMQICKVCKGSEIYTRKYAARRLWCEKLTKPSTMGGNRTALKPRHTPTMHKTKLINSVDRLDLLLYRRLRFSPPSPQSSCLYRISTHWKLSERRRQSFRTIKSGKYLLLFAERPVIHSAERKLNSEHWNRGTKWKRYVS